MDPVDIKFQFDFRAEKRFEVRREGRNKSLINLFNSPTIRVGSIRKTRAAQKRLRMKPTQNLTFLFPNPNELCERLLLLVYEKKAGSISERFFEKIFATADKLLEYMGVSIK